MANFVGQSSSFQGGCHLLNTAIDADDGNPVLRDRGRQALQQWCDRLSSIISAGIRQKEIGSGVNPKKLAILLISLLEAALMVSRLEGDREAVLWAESHLERYMDSEVQLRTRA